MAKKVHWLGAGLSTGSGLAQVAKNSELFLWNRSLQKAENLVKKLDLVLQVKIKKYDILNFAKELQAGDIVVCMLESSLHFKILELCLKKKSHFISSSYQNPKIKKLALQAKKRGIVVGLESGLDPGIDHLFAYKLIERCKKRVAADRVSVQLESYCGGFPQISNDFFYNFSWSPLGVFTALKSPTKHIENGKIVETTYPWHAIKPYFVESEELESYPNRNSLIYQEQYKIPNSWKIDKLIRGTLRLKGWKNAWQEVFQILQNGSKDEMLKLANQLAKKYSYQSGDLDRVLLFVRLRAYSLAKKKEVWQGTIKLDLVGEAKDSAMSKTVSQTLACAVEDILEQQTTSGVYLATENHWEKWLEKLAARGLDFKTYWT